MTRKWWKECVVYQIYPRSFCDSNEDGIGDIQGIISKLSYLKDLGIGALWLNPVYASPNDDMGYDISDYESIMAEFGTMADFDELLSKAHALNIKIIMDLVVNHSSDEHAWFIESRKSKESKFRDYYIWKKGKDGKEPNNWASFFTPSAWKYDTMTDEYYLHLFSEKQPDLNWENDSLRNEIYGMINRWLDKGVDGFRMDVINLIAKKEGLPDGQGEKTVSGYVFSEEHFANQELLFQYLDEMRAACFKDRDAMCVGETPFVNPTLGDRFTNEIHPYLDMIFQFELMDIDSGKSGKWEIVPYSMDKFKRIIQEWQQVTEQGWGSLFWSNHDQPRPISRFVRFTTEHERIKAAKMLGTAMHLLKGTSYIYQGEEIGMTNSEFTDAEQLKDIESLVFLEEMKKAGKEQEAWNAIQKKGRDHARTPMQWSDEIYAGFSKVEPWLMINKNYPSINVMAAQEDPDSILNFYKKLIRLKTENMTAIYGKYEDYDNGIEGLFGYRRILNDSSILVLCNMTADRIPFNVQRIKELLLGNYTVQNSEYLEAFETRVYQE